MIKVLIVGIAILPTTACICGSIWMMSLEKAGWGWLLFLALLLGQLSIRFQDGVKTDDA